MADPYAMHDLMTPSSRAPSAVAVRSWSRVLRAMSLDALRGFESAARHMSFTAAADELCLTQSAISKQVRALEDALGVPLFVRGARGLALTPQGRVLREAVSQSLEQLGAAVEQLVAPSRAMVAVTTTPSFAALWLTPRLARFHADAPDIDVRVDASEAMANLERDGFDIAIRLRAPGHASPMLLRERLMLVATPALAQRVRSPVDLAAMPLLVYHDPAERFGWMSWQHWYARMGLSPRADQPCLYFSRYEHLITAAARGAGIAIGRAPLILPLLASGELAVLLPDQVADGMEYELAVADRGGARGGNEQSPAARFCGWLQRELAADVAG